MKPTSEPRHVYCKQKATDVWKSIPHTVIKKLEYNISKTRINKAKDKQKYLKNNSCK